ncbi:MAG: hypothetical protein FWE14_08335 [Lachnospiraceae bacterium]|nr:hypothetical protein [Lachnospiraceae bacterium]
MKKKLLIAGGVFIIILTGFFIALTNGLSAGKSIKINGINLTNVSDGNYAGL